MTFQETRYQTQQTESFGIGQRLLIVLVIVAGMALLSVFITPIISGG